MSDKSNKDYAIPTLVKINHPSELSSALNKYLQVADKYHIMYMDYMNLVTVPNDFHSQLYLRIQVENSSLPINASYFRDDQGLPYILLPSRCNNSGELTTFAYDISDELKRRLHDHVIHNDKVRSNKNHGQ